MEITKKLGAIEAILFASGDPIEIYRLSEASGVDVGTIPRLVRLLNERYDDCGSGLCIKKARQQLSDVHARGICYDDKDSA